MIKIRYACLPEGLHATAVTRGRHAVVYLRPGLPPGQRRDAVARLRRNARLGYAPPLPAAGMAWALATDRVRRTLRDVFGAVQCHPLGTLGLAGVLAGAAVSYLTLMGTPLPAGAAGPAGGLPASADGEAAAATGTGLPASGLVPLGMKPRPWTVPETRPRRRRAGQGQPAPAPLPRPAPRRGSHRHPGRGRTWQPPGGHRWPSGTGRDRHGWPPAPRPPRRRPGQARWPDAGGGHRPARPQPSRGQASRGQASRGQASRGQASRGEFSRGRASRGPLQPGPRGPGQAGAAPGRRWW